MHVRPQQLVAKKHDECMPSSKPWQGQLFQPFKSFSLHYDDSIVYKTSINLGSKSLHFKSLKLQMLDIQGLQKWLKLLIRYQNHCQLLLTE